MKVLKDVTEFIKKRAVLEAEYAKKLQELCKTVPGSGMFSKSAPIDKESKYEREWVVGGREDVLPTKIWAWNVRESESIVSKIE